MRCSREMCSGEVTARETTGERESGNVAVGAVEEEERVEGVKQQKKGLLP